MVSDQFSRYEQLFAEYCAKLFPVLKNRARRLGVRHASQSSVAQSAMADVWKKVCSGSIPDFNDEELVRRLAFKIVYHKVITRHRHATGVRRVVALPDRDVLPARAGLDASDIAYALECWSRVREILDDSEWEVLSRRLAGENNVEIQAALAISYATLRRRLVAAMRVVISELREFDS